MNIFILAGGSGSRLWPFSRHMTPKQFLNLGSTHESLLQETCRRLEGLVHESQIRVIGSKFHEYELKQQLQQVYSEFPEANLLLEPVGRNTACCALGVKPAFSKRPAGPLTDPACRSPDRGS